MLKNGGKRKEPYNDFEILIPLFNLISELSFKKVFITYGCSRQFTCLFTCLLYWLFAMWVPWLEHCSTMSGIFMCFNLLGMPTT